MAWSNSTPAWWQSTPTTVQVGLLVVFLPGVLLHELTHAIVASPNADVTVVWDEVAVVMVWTPGTPRAAIALAHLAPLLLGWAAGAILVAGHVLLDAGTNDLVTLYVLAQWLLYTVPVLGDVNF